MTTVEHHADSLDLGEHGFLEATRDDTDELQDYRLIAWKNGRKMQEFRDIYNIQYDYFRRQEWWKGELIWDYLVSNHGYGHLLYEFDYGLYGPEGWIPSMDENRWEPVTPLGAQIFREEGILHSMILTENQVHVYIYFYNLKYIDRWQIPVKLLTVKTMDMNNWSDREWVEKERRSLNEISSERQSKRKHKSGTGTSLIDRLRFYKKHREEIGVEIPIDPRMVY